MKPYLQGKTRCLLFTCDRRYVSLENKSFRLSVFDRGLYRYTVMEPGESSNSAASNHRHRLVFLAFYFSVYYSDHASGDVDRRLHLKQRQPQRSYKWGNNAEDDGSVAG